MIGRHERVRPAFLGLAPLVVPALGHRFRAGIRDEMVIDVVHPEASASAASIAAASRRCRPSGSQPSAMAASRGRSVRRCGSRAIPASGPAWAAIRCLNCSAVAAPSAKQLLTADSSAASCALAARRLRSRRRQACPG